MGLFSFAGSLLGGGSLKKGLTKAANAQQASSDQQIGRLESALDTTTANYSPYTQLGSAGASAFADLLGLGGGNDWQAYLTANPDVLNEYTRNVDKTLFPTAEDYAQWHYGQYGSAEGRDSQAQTGEEAQSAAIAALKESPLYQSLYSTGEEALLANASATGGLRGGNTETGLANFGRDTLASVIQQQLSNYSGAINSGLSATGAVTNATYNTATGSNTAQQAATDALIQKILGKAGINSQNWNNAGGILDKAAGSLLGGKSLGSTIKGLF